MGPPKNSKELGNAARRECDRAHSAAMTDEQREEKNRIRRESYKRKKCSANNKENEPDGIINAPGSGIVPKLLSEDHACDRILTVLKSDDKRIEINKKRCETYRTKKDEIQNKSKFAAEHHVQPLTGAPITIIQDEHHVESITCTTSTMDAPIRIDHYDASIVCKPPVTEHHAVGVTIGVEQYGTPTTCSVAFNENNACKIVLFV